ncbi:MAG: DUF5665 domain-containing protein [Desulfitobacteriaceae bacterium]
MKLNWICEVTTLSGSNDERLSPEQRPRLEHDLGKDMKPHEWAQFREQVVVLTDVLEKMRLAEYIAYLNHPGRLLWINFAVGLLRGLGAAIGATILAGLAIGLLKWLGILNLPIIGNFIAELVRIVNSHNGSQ